MNGVLKPGFLKPGRFSFGLLLSGILKPGFLKPGSLMAELLKPGALINTARYDGTPCFLTDNHCVPSSTKAESIIPYFNYESPTCKGEEGPKDQTVSGARIVATTYHLDFSLIELGEEPTPSYVPCYSGWDARDVPPASVVGIHHPEGDMKKISSYSRSPVTGDFTYLYDFDDNTHRYIPKWSTGITGAGSSGSPLFNEKKQIGGHEPEYPAGNADRGKRNAEDGYACDVVGSVPGPAFRWNINGNEKTADTLNLWQA